MAIDFSKPATTDNYSSAFVPALVNHQTALAQWLDSTQTTITGTPPTYAKRYNRTTSAVEEFNGSAWAPMDLHGLTYSAGNLGVGYGTPAHKLDLGPAVGTGRARIRGVMIGNAASGYPTVGYNASPSGTAAWTYDLADSASWIQFNGANTQFFIATSGAAGAAIAPIEYLHVDAAGNLGMGTSSPTSNGATYRNIELRGASGGGAFMYAGDAAGAKSRFGYSGAAGGTAVASLNTDPIVFDVNFVTGMTLTTGGLGIGMTPTRKLDVAGNVGATLFVGPLSGNAATATALATARTINGVAFDGSANIALPAPGAVAAGATDGSNELGFKGLPAASVASGAFGVGDKGKCVYATAGVTVPNAVMAGGDVVTIVNTTASPITITASITTLRQAGTANTGNRTLAGYGIATVVFSSGALAFIAGTGLS